jgi:hypothetical protein
VFERIDHPAGDEARVDFAKLARILDDDRLSRHGSL